MKTNLLRLALTSIGVVSLAIAPGCVAGHAGGLEPWQVDDGPLDGDPDAVTLYDETPEVAMAEVICGPRMYLFPVGEAHNIGYDARTCGDGRCDVSCPDANANSDWNGAAGHHGIDVFARRGAPLIAVADGTVVRVGTPSSTSGLRVRLRDDCGWEYYYGHMDAVAVREGQRVSAGDLLGTMGNTGTSGVHLHFNVSPDGRYSSDINPFDLLRDTSGTVCGATEPEPTPAPGPTPEPAPMPDPGPGPSPSACGGLASGTSLARGEGMRSCDGRFLFIHQSDGNVVLYQGDTPLFHTGTHGRATTELAMQSDGNLVLYGPGGTVLFHTGTHGHPGASLAVQDDGNVVIYGSGGALWHTRTCCH